MNRKKFVFLLLAILMVGSAYSQDFIIKHDLVADKTSYFRVSTPAGNKPADTSAVKSFLLKKQAKLTFSVENYNPYYWHAKATAINIQDDDKSTNAGLFNPFSIFAQGFGGLMKDIIPGLDIKGLESRGYAEEGTGNDVYIFWASLYQDVYTRYRKLIIHTDELTILKKRLTELKYNISLPAKDIKQTAKDAVASVVETTSLNFENVLNKARYWNNEYYNLSDSLQIIVKKLNQLAPGTVSSYTFEGTTLGQVKDQIKETDSIYKVNKSAPDFFTPLSDVATLYNDIQSADYRYSYTLNNANEYSQIKLQLYSRIDTKTSDTITKYFPIRSKGILRLRNSVGIAFSYFADKNKSYYVRSDTTIGKGSADYFTPIISTFIHVYGYSTSNFKIGGTIGFGIPVTGEKHDINYLLGLSGIIGKNEPIMISLGASGAKVTKPGKGWQVGNKVPDLNFEIPTADVFRLGLFLSISFNLGRMTVSKSDN